MTDQAEDPDREYNLWDPVDDDVDHGIHGRFDDKAREQSYLFWAETHRGLLLRVGVLIIALAGALLAQWKVQSERGSQRDNQLADQDGVETLPTEEDKRRQ